MITHYGSKEYYEIRILRSVPAAGTVYTKCGMEYYTFAVWPGNLIISEVENATCDVCSMLRFCAQAKAEYTP